MRRRHLLATLPLLASLRARAATAADTAPIPVELLFQRQAYRDAVLSPDSRFLAAIVRTDARSQLSVIDLERRTGRQLTAIPDADVVNVRWTGNSRLLYTTGDVQGIDPHVNGGLFGIDVDGSNQRMLVEPFFGGSQVRFAYRFTELLRRCTDADDEYLVAANDRSADTADLYRLNVMSGRKQLLSFKTPGHVARWVADARDQPRAALSIDFRSHRWWFSARLDPDADEWTTLAEWDEQLRDVIVPMGFDAQSGTRLFVASNVGRDTLALFTYDLKRRQLGELIYADDRYDIHSFMLAGAPLGEEGRLLYSRAEKGAVPRLLGLRYQAERPKVIWFDAAAAQAQASVDAALPGRTNLFDPVSQRALVFSASDTEPGEYFIFDREHARIEETGIRTLPRLSSRAMRPMQPVAWKARDGIQVSGYLTLPATWKAGRPVPLVLHPHGGPWARDGWGFNREVQLMASRGFAVLQVNFRGSTGYGAKHLRLSYKQFGGTMIDDMLDGVDWAIAAGYADRRSIGVYGASYGGYATLMAMEQRPELFRWGVNYVGVTDLGLHQRTQPAQLYGDFYHVAQRVIGDADADAEVFEAQSPARHVERVAAPVLHAYGGEDVNVDVANGKEIRRAFDKAGKAYEWILLPTEAHGFRQDAHVVDFYKRLIGFMLEHGAPATS